MGDQFSTCIGPISREQRCEIDELDSFVGSRSDRSSCMQLGSQTDTSFMDPSVSSNIEFGEAADGQLGAQAFGEPLSEADFLEREEFMRHQALALGKGVRIWCLYRSDVRFQVLATCKIMKR
jgi:hypothetical protein